MDKLTVSTFTSVCVVMFWWGGGAGKKYITAIHCISAEESVPTSWLISWRVICKWLNGCWLLTRCIPERWALIQCLQCTWFPFFLKTSYSTKPFEIKGWHNRGLNSCGMLSSLWCTEGCATINSVHSPIPCLALVYKAQSPNIPRPVISCHLCNSWYFQSPSISWEIRNI